MTSKEMLQTLKDNTKISVLIGEDITESYIGARENIYSYVDNITSFENDKQTGLILTEDGELFNNNIEYAYKHYIMQKHAFPIVL